jgi:hypothetical protein
MQRLQIGGIRRAEASDDDTRGRWHHRDASDAAEVLKTLCLFIVASSWSL